MAVGTVQPGDLVAQKYRIERVVGQGGMGIVVAAVDVTRGTRLALKFLLPQALRSASMVARFEREARASLALESEHVCRALDVGRRSDGTPYIAMELLDGMDLAQAIHRRGGPLPIVLAVGYIVQACDAIAEAHARGIIHRDLKPANLFLANRKVGDPIIKVLDFGISKPTSLGQSPSALTGTADLLGSPLYMSPEQLRAAKSVDARTDVWSLGATLYELVTGKPPFDGSTIADLAANILGTPAPDVRRHVPNAPPPFAEVIERALAKSRDERYQSVDELVRALAPFGSATARTVPLAPITPRDSNRTLAMKPSSVPAPPSSAPVRPPSTPGAVAPAAPSSASAVDDPPSPPPNSSLATPMTIGIVALASAVGLGLLVFVLTRSKDEPRPQTPSASASASSSPSPPSSASAASEAASVASAPIPPEPAPELDASSERAAPRSLPSPPPLPRPSSVPSALPDARVFESAGY